MERKNILFLCTGNSCRSQIAEAWTGYLRKDLFIPYSAGVNPGVVDINAVKVMNEVGIDISQNQAKHVDSLAGMRFDYVVTVCDHANETCPFFPGNTRRIHQSFDDPPKLAAGLDEKAALGIYRRVRDEIKGFVESMPDVFMIIKETV